MSIAEVQPDQPNPNVQGLLLYGEGLQSMTPERFDMLSQMVGGLGLKVTTVGDIETLGVSAEQVEPCIATKDEFITFARAQGYTDARARKAWGATTFASMERNAKGLPPTRFTDRGEFREYGNLLDLLSVAERLEASRYTTTGWPSATPDTVKFLRHLVDERLPRQQDSES